ncbi:MAG: putative oxidoreductase SadH [Bacteroidota bacterium]|jgi:short-subunit dehydrogenase
MLESTPIVWITGASSGIGEALAYYLSAQGYRIIISARNLQGLESVRSKCAFTERVALVQMDLAEWQNMHEVVQAAIGCFGGVDILINNAGLSQRSLIAETDMTVYVKLMEVNYLGTVALTKALLPHWLDRKTGQVVTVTSLMGRFGSPLRSGYCGAKHALHGFFDVLRMEHEKDGLKVTLVCPGFVNTNIARNAVVSDGSLQGYQDTATASGMDPNLFARKLWSAVKASKFEVYLGGKEILGIYLKRFFPKLLHRVVLRSQVV